jgi:hypothetical protein
LDLDPTLLTLTSLGSNTVRWIEDGWLRFNCRANRYLLIRIVGSRSGGSDLLRLDLILSARLASYGSGRWAHGTAAPATGARLPRRRLARAGQTRPSRLSFGRYQALEVERGTEYSSGGLRGLNRAWVRAPHGKGGSGSLRPRERAHAEGGRKGEGARRGPYHAWKW